MASYEVSTSNNESDVWIIVITDYGKRSFVQIPVETAADLANEITRVCKSIGYLDAHGNRPQPR